MLFSSCSLKTNALDTLSVVRLLYDQVVTSTDEEDHTSCLRVVLGCEIALKRRILAMYPLAWLVVRLF